MAEGSLKKECIRWSKTGRNVCKQLSASGGAKQSESEANEMPCSNKAMGPLITIKATYHVPFETNTIRGIGSECSRFLIEVKIH